MKGNIIGFDPDTNTGAVNGHDGKSYDFATLDWHSHHRPKHGDLVDFVPEGQRATQVYLLEPEYVRPSFGEFYFSPRGRIGRSQYWLRFFLPMFVIGIVFSIIGTVGGDGAKLLENVWQLLVLWPSIAILIKRIHDRNKSGALVWALYGPMIPAVALTIAAVVAVALGSGDAAWGWGIVAGIFWVAVLGVGIWFFIEFGCMRGTIGANRYGPDPVPPA
jgi:uncharacterized membrane protein YhaH (DUF805 family)